MIASTRLRAALLRISALATTITLFAAPAFAQEHGAEAASGPPNLLAPQVGLMFWTLVIFAILLIVLSKYAFKPLFQSVEEREKALEDAIEGAKRDRAEAAELLAQQRALLEAGRADAQKFIADSRSVAEKMRAEMLAETKHQQESMLDGARRSIEGEKLAAIAQLRRESVDLAIAGASRVIEQNLDNTNNRRIVETFLSSLDGAKVANS
ncbi:MAG TPA: F0F1 ATP synthase subunit B [Gemmatimonas sp.]|nr:F0F1 ATP synthase subunit B [Gemmatimonas sp.]